MPLPRAFLLLGAAAAFLAGCGRGLEPPQKSGELRVLTRTSTTTYYLGPDRKPAGFEYDLAKRFADQNGWELKVRPAITLGRLLARLEGGEAHMAVAGLAITPERERKFLFGPPYAEEKEVVVCASGSKLPANLDDMAGLRLEVVLGSSHVEQLQVLKKSHPDLVWKEVRAPSEEELLERVASGLTDCVVADSVSFDVAWNFLPTLRVAFDLGPPRQIAWALPRTADPAFLAAMQAFFKEIEASGQLEDLKERYFGHVRRLSEADVLGILEKRTTLLPELKPHFQRAQEVTGLDWRFLAALAYQESQWNASAVSPTGVRGIMMLTEQTADHLGVKNRLDVEESILGGARYVVMLKDSLSPAIAEPDRVWLALAAYNIGMGHLEDARRLTGRLGKNPDSWRDVKEVLPLIAKAKYAKTLRHGYARGGEARALAENVRIYYDILARYEPAHDFRLGLGG
jgi:membrane-bound lytic murein transglycosylase F